MIRQFNLDETKAAWDFFHEQKSATLRIAKAAVFVFTPSNEAIGHPSGQVKGEV